MYYSNKPFNVLCLKTAQELVKIKANHLTRTHSFLFLLTLSNAAKILSSQTCHAENHSLKIPTQHAASTKPLIFSSTQNYWIREE